MTAPRARKPRVPKALQRDEHDEQVALFTWIQSSPLGIRTYAAMAFAIPNFAGHHGSKIARIKSGRRAKAEGRKAGVPDVFLPVSRAGFHGLFIEMKKVNGVPSDVDDVQRAWHRCLKMEGYAVVVAFGFEEARDAILNYLTVESR